MKTIKPKVKYLHIFMDPKTKMEPFLRDLETVLNKHDCFGYLEP